MFSVSLVIWEIMRRCELVNEKNETIVKADEYKAPYFEYLTSDEPVKDNELCFRRVVCELKLRPTLKSEWRSNGVLNEICQIVEELWTEEPNERLNSFRLSKTLNKIRINYINK